MSELRFNVAQLLQEHVGAIRVFEFDEPQLDLGDGLTIEAVSGQGKFIRTKSGVLAHVEADGIIQVECVRCLELYAQPVALDFEEEFYATVHPTDGTLLPDPEGDDVFRINSNHLLDMGSAIREYALLALPIAPICRETCAGIALAPAAEAEASADDDQDVDDRLAALKKLLH